MRPVHAKAPLRLGLAGGGTDVSPYSDLYGGQVLNATIGLYTHCHISASADGRVHFVATDFDQDESFDVEVAERGFEGVMGGLVLHRAVFRKVVDRYNEGRLIGLTVTTYSDAPPGSGVGSSSALVVCMVRAYCELLQLPLGEYDIAHLAYEIERVDCAMSGGKQDQYAAAFGGFNFMEFGADDRVVVNPLRLKRELSAELEARLLLYYTGRSRESARIIESQIAATQQAGSDAVEAMHEIRRAALEMKEALLRGRIPAVLEILGASWLAKKRAAAGISNDQIDQVARTALDAGASGLKISGAGGGGFMMIAVDPQSRFKVVRALQPSGGQFFNFHFVDEGAESWTTSC